MAVDANIITGPDPSSPVLSLLAPSGQLTERGEKKTRQFGLNGIMMRSLYFLSLLTIPTQAFAPMGSSLSQISHTGSDSRLFSAATIELKEGLLKTISKAGTGEPIKRGDMALVKYSCYVPNSPPFAKSESQRLKIGNGDMIEGWEEALQTMSVGERAVVRITDPTMAYGEAGVPHVIPPNSEIEMDIEILSTQSLADFDFQAFGVGDPNTPRTAESIKAAYSELMAQKALEPQKEGLEGFIETAKGWYFFGLFGGETGQEAPWFLKPSITFPLAFLIVGATFYVSLVSGGITERGSQVTDELDQIILSMQYSQPAGALVATAFTLLAAIPNMPL